MINKLLFFSLSIIVSMIFHTCEKQDENTRTVQELQNFIIEDTISDEKIVKEGKFPILFSHRGPYGYLDSQLKIIVPPIYDNGFNYTDHGYALVSYSDENGLREGRILDREGNIVFRRYDAGISMLYDDIISYRPIGEIYPRIIRFLSDTIIMDASGIEAAELGDEIIIYVRFTPGIERGFIDSTGKRILPHLDLRRMSRGFREDRAIAVVGEKSEIRIIDINGNFYGNLNFFRTGRNYYEGLVPAETTDGLTGYINKNGEFAFYVPIVADIPEYDESPLNATDFAGGYAIVQTVLDPPIWRVIDNRGNFVSGELPLIRAGAFSDGLSRVRVDFAKYGYINTKGEMVISPVFEDANSFRNGYARIVYQGKDGIINLNGEIFWSDEIVNAQ